MFTDRIRRDILTFAETYIPQSSQKTNEIGYRNLLRRILSEGVNKDDRTGTGTRSLHGQSITYDLRDSIPLFTSKKVHAKTAINEMLCFLNAQTHLSDYHARNVHVWDKFADETGSSTEILMVH